MPWLEVRLIVDDAAQPRVESALECAGALSITLVDAAAETPEEHAIFEPDVGETPLWRSLALLALFDPGVDRTVLLDRLRAALPDLAPACVTFREIADRDWERAWLDRFRPMPFGRRLWIYPSGIEAPDDRDRVIVRLDPGLAFGTGTHPTTALCLEWLDGLELAGLTVLDYGCGSGVLAIAALKLGAARAIGVDHDPQALAASRDNAQRNRVAGRFSACTPGGLPAPVRCDVLVANILAGPLLELAPRLARSCSPGAPFALSGILAGQQPELLECFAACGFAGMQVTARDGWLRIAGRRS
jgi:ribosomal protein L11 methyltransferase